MSSNSQVRSRPYSSAYRVTIDYADTFAERLDAGGYDFRSSGITERNFPVTGEGIVECNLELAHYGRDMSNESVLAAIDADGYRPAKIEELLAFGAKYPELQREFPIVALGSVWRDLRGDRYVVGLGKDVARRELSLCWLAGDWYAFHRFLVVRK